MPNIPENGLLNFLQKFEHLPAEVLSAVDSCTSRIALPKKTILLKKGKICDNLYFIEKGMARNYYKAEEKELTIDITVEGALLTSFSSFVSRQPSNEAIELMEDCQLVAIHYNDLQQLYQTYPVMERIGRLIAEHNYNSLKNHNYMLKFNSTTERYEYLFNNKIEIIRRAPIGIIASYLGMSIETLSRIRSKHEI